jgi:hypothetical protein
MVPVDLDFLQDRVGHALGCLAQALASAVGPQRVLLLDAMNALDDVDALVEIGFDLAGAETPTLRLLPAASMPEVALVA